MFTLSNFKIFNSRNVKNKECVHTWANDIGYTTYEPFILKIKAVKIYYGP